MKIIIGFIVLWPFIGFLLNGAVVFKIALPMMVFNMLGGYIGSKAAILKGNVFIRYVFLLVISILIIRLGRDVIISWQ